MHTAVRCNDRTDSAMTDSSIDCQGSELAAILPIVDIVSVVSCKIVSREKHRRSLDVSRFILAGC